MLNVELMIDVKNMKELMCGCDLAVSAAGSTLYELCVCSVPTITYVIADNQLQASKAFDRKGIMVNIGDTRKIKNIGNLIVDSINKLSIDYQKRELMSRLSYQKVNTKGAKQLADIINWKE